MNNLRRGCLISNVKCASITRQIQTNADLVENCAEIKNRNPRNLEFMRIARKPDGYHLEKPGHMYWNKYVEICFLVSYINFQILIMLFIVLRLFVKLTAKHIEASINHFKHGPFITVSTHEWALKKQLYRYESSTVHAHICLLLLGILTRNIILRSHGVAAFTNVGRVLAVRCLESGINAVCCDLDTEHSQRYAALLDAMKEGGVSLEEPPMYVHYNAWDKDRMVKPWTIEE